MIKKMMQPGYRVWLWLFILMMAPSLIACRQAVNTEEPPELIIGQDVCDQCGMLISDDRFAAAYWTATGEARRFDDIGGMLAYYHKYGEEVASFWVHDFTTSEWLLADQATFLIDSEQQTPMGFGIIAFAGAEQAQARSEAGNGELVTFTELVERTAAEDLAVPDSHNH